MWESRFGLFQAIVGTVENRALTIFHGFHMSGISTAGLLVFQSLLELRDGGPESRVSSDPIVIAFDIVGINIYLDRSWGKKGPRGRRSPSVVRELHKEP